MAELGLRQAYAALKRDEISPAYYLTGSEDILKDDLVSAITDRVVDPASRDFNVDVRSAGDLNGESFHALVETPPMLADRRVVVVRGVESWRRNAKVWLVVHRYLERPSQSTVLILTSGKDQKPDKTLSASACHVVASALRPEEVRRWIRKRAREADLDLDPEAADHLVEVTGPDLSYLAVEIEKLAAAAPEGRPLAASDVATLVGVRRGETVHDWVDAVLTRETGRSLELLSPVLSQSGISGVQMVMALGTALVGTRHARALLDRGTPPGRLRQAVFQSLQRARPARLRPWKVEAAAWTQAAQRWTGPELDAAIAAAYEADKQLKSTTITNERGVLQTLVLGIASRGTA